MMIVAKWESRGRKHFIELTRSANFYYYRGRYCGGSLASSVTTDEAAVAVMQTRLDKGDFLPDKAKLPMKRVI